MTHYFPQPDILKRLKRAHGHLKTVLTMMEDERPSLEIVQQLQAVENAITNAKKRFIRDHIDHCLEHARKNDEGAEDAVNEFKEITKYL